MITTIDRAGRLVIPKRLREQAGLRAGEPLDVRYVDGRIEIEPRAAELRLEDKGGVLVAKATLNDTEALTVDQVEAVRAALRSERG